MTVSRQPRISPAAGETFVDWLSRFVVSLREECRITLGANWEADVDESLTTVRAWRESDKAEVTATLHPGMQVVAPSWAARRLADQLQLIAVSHKLIRPPDGSAATGKQP